ncbi:uncharacterized protein [Hoplias malabaricus]|uniref:uncharacterized protein n=1 Tax=Hoplias malabaricus TaxID=27720 RepID=UPI003462E7BF
MLLFALKVMEAGNHDGAVNEAEDTDDLLCTDMDEETVSDFNHGLSALPRDHCDLLLDAIDAHLSCLQTHSHVQVNGRKSTMEVCLDRSNSVSKDTGLGSTDLSIDKATSTPDEPNSDHLDLSTVRVSKGQIEAVGQQDKNHTKDSKSEQCLWRLQQLLGTSRVGVKEYVAEELDSVCTEDFSTRFKEEMLEIYDPSSDGAAADSAPDAASISSDTGLLTDPQIIQNFIQNQGRIQNVNENCVKSFNRHLAGIF